MPRLSSITAGESHGPGMLTIVSGLPHGLRLDLDLINAELARRQGGYGRSGRQNIEHDVAEVLSGVRNGRTIGSPITLRIANRDSRLDDAARTPPIFNPRPGHADLAGAIKYLTTDCRDVLERASARETAARTAAGTLARCLLREFGVEPFAFVRSILTASCDTRVTSANWRELRIKRDASDTHCPEEAASEKQRGIIREAKTNKDTVGGLIECHVFGCPPGLGSCMDWRDRLDSRLAGAVMGIQAIKSVEIGLGRDSTLRPGSRVHDPITYVERERNSTTLGFDRADNNAGGIEGGMSNGQPIVVRAAMKPIPTLGQGLPSIDLRTREAHTSQYERSDVCAVPAASVVVENVVAFEIACAFLDKFSGDTMGEVRGAYDAFMRHARDLPTDPPVMRLA